jgi:hypothetical protein
MLPLAFAILAADPPAPTFTRDVAPIVQERCLGCHRDGGVGPFPLATYEDVSRRASMVRATIEDGSMPPWFAAPHGDGPSPWRNDASLSKAERETIVRWIAAGKPRGDDADLPKPPSFDASGWSIGTPNATYELPAAITIPAEGTMPYRIVAVETDQPEDRWIRSVEIRPTAPAVVHHVLVFVAKSGEGRLRERFSREDGRGFFAAYVPGNSWVTYPDGYAKKLPKGATLVFQIHYTPNGRATEDRLRIGFRFADAPPKHVVRTASVADRRLSIPPGAADHRSEATVDMPFDVRLLSFMPHMHVRGKAFRYEIERPDGTVTIPLDIPRYDFNWQLRYELREPLELPKGSRLTGIARYDNSAANPANPDPGRTVRWGQQTFDEMMLGYFEYVTVEDDPTRPDVLPDASESRLDFESLRKRFDRDGDGAIDRSEVPSRLHPAFDRLDRDGDGRVTREDFPR